MRKLLTFGEVSGKLVSKITYKVSVTKNQTCIEYSNLMRILVIVKILIRLCGIQGTWQSITPIHHLYIYDKEFFNKYGKNKMTIQQTLWVRKNI